MDGQWGDRPVPSVIFATYFSAYSARMIIYGGVLYPTVEHAYHCQRYEDPEVVRAILTAHSPYEAWGISQQYKGQQMPDFAARKVEVMQELCRAKLEQHEDVRQALLDTGRIKIVKHIVTGPEADAFWDDGADGTGRNEVGKIWMRLRDELLAVSHGANANSA